MHLLPDSGEDASLTALLPPKLQRSPYVVFSGAYIPSTPDLPISGDWYDAFRRLDRTYAFSIGDVEGRGVTAALTMVKIRAALYAFGLVTGDAVTSLHHLDTFVDREHPQLFATAFEGRYDHERHLLNYASAGHPAPFLRSDDGSVRRLANADLPLGVGSFSWRSLHEIELRPGDLLVGFTDGLSEITDDPEEGERRIAHALADRAVAAAPNPADALGRRLLEGQPHDDIAILAMRVVA